MHGSAGRGWRRNAQRHRASPSPNHSHDEDAAHIRDRSARYPGAIDIEPDWTLEAAADVHQVVRDPDPKSTAAYVRIIGYSPSANFVRTVIVDPHDWSGVTAWKTRGADLRE